MSDQFKTPSNVDEQVSILFLKYHNLVRLFAFEMAPSRDLTEDIVNDVYIDFAKKADHWDLNSNVVPLLRRITRNIALQYWKEYVRNLPETMRKIANLIQRETELTSVSFSDSDLGMELDLLQHCLDRLPRHHYELIMAHYFDHKSYNEMSESGDKSAGSIQRMVSRIRTIIRKCVETALRSKFGEISHGE